jgi:hypothetical protein
LKVGEQCVADPALQGAERFFSTFALGDLLVVIGASLTIAMADLGDGSHVDGVVEPPVAAPGESVDLAIP